jgi:hypothetical protein
MVTLRFKTKTGETAELRVEQLLSIDGKPATSAEDLQGVLLELAHLAGRVSALETILAQGSEP